MTNNLLVEVCCGSYDDVVAAKNAGADRVELNSALFLGGLTPSLGSLRLVKKNVDIKVITMTRPRAAGFLYSNLEFDVIKEDARLFLENGADGVVFGFLNANGDIDKLRTAEMVKIIGTKDAVFHRAFDVTKDPYKAIYDLIDCGVKRVLTSGLEPSVFEGIELIKELHEKYGNKIEILPGAGITSKNVNTFIKFTGVSQIHIAVLEQRPEPSVSNRKNIYYGGALYPREDQIEVISQNGLEQIIKNCGD